MYVRRSSILVPVSPIFEAIETTSWPSSRSGSAALSDAMQAIALCRDAGEGVGA